jgi:hypothetical protein
MRDLAHGLTALNPLLAPPAAELHYPRGSP